MKPKHIIIILIAICFEATTTLAQNRTCDSEGFLKFYNLGKGQLAKKDYTNAIKNIDKAFKICPSCQDCKDMIMVCLNANYEQIGQFYDGLALIEKDGKFGFVDARGTEIVEPVYDMAWNFNEGLAVVKQNNKFGLVDLTGKITVPPQYESLSRSCEGMLSFEANGKHGFINNKGKVVIAAIYDNVFRFENGIAKVIFGGTRLYINRKGVCVKDCP